MPELLSTANLLAYALTILACAAAVRLAPRASGAWVVRAEAWLALPWAPLVAALASGLVVAWVGGWTLHPVPVYHDERAYLLQAELFARGQWTGAPAPLPEFFTQLHVFVTPYLAAKYPLGNSLLLAPFAALRAPGLGPVVFGAIGGGFVFALARRAAGGVVALATLLLWMPAGPVLMIRASYMSQIVTVPLWLATWWAMARYHTGGHRAWLVMVCLTVATCAIVRPLTALALAVPCAWVLVPLATRRRDWPMAGAALAFGVAVLGLLPLQNARTTGDWRTSPLLTYTREVTPFDFPTFGFNRAQKLAPLPTDLARARESLIVPREVHTLGNLPALIPWRLSSLAQATWQGWRLPLALVALFGIAALGALAPMARVPVACATLLFVLHLMHAHSPIWTVFYHEAVPVLAFVTALGVVSLARKFHARRDPGRAPALGSTALLLATLAAAPAQVLDTSWSRERLELLKRPQRAFLDAVAKIPEPKAIVFVKYPASFSGHRSLVGNPSDYAEARAWLVYDRGAENDLLRHLAPGRAAYWYDAGFETLERLPPAPPITP